MTDGGRIGKGLSPFLPAITVVEERDDGVLVLRVPELASERLARPDVLGKLEEALARHSGRESARISIVAEGGGGETDAAASPGPSSPASPRVSRETVRATRLEELVRKAPYLERAVAELDLEFVD